MYLISDSDGGPIKLVTDSDDRESAAGEGTDTNERLVDAGEVGQGDGGMCSEEWEDMVEE